MQSRLDRQEQLTCLCFSCTSFMVVGIVVRARVYCAEDPWPNFTSLHVSRCPLSVHPITVPLLLYDALAEILNLATYTRSATKRRPQPAKQRGYIDSEPGQRTGIIIPCFWRKAGVNHPALIQRVVPLAKSAMACASSVQVNFTLHVKISTIPSALVRID